MKFLKLDDSVIDKPAKWDFYFEVPKSMKMFDHNRHSFQKQFWISSFKESGIMYCSLQIND